MEKAKAQLRALLPSDQRHTDRFLSAFLGRASNRRLVALAAAGDVSAKQRIMARLRLSEVEARFWSYLKKTLQWETARLVRELSERAAIEALTLNEPRNDGDGGSDAASRVPDRTDAADVAEAVAATAASLEESVENPALSAALAALSPRQQQVLQLLYVADCSEREAAATLGISQQAVNKAKIAGLRRLRRVVHDVEAEA